jgi:putative flippase GtrA
MVRDVMMLWGEVRRVGWRAALGEVLRPDAPGSWQLMKYLLIGGLSVVVFISSCALFRLMAVYGIGASYEEHRVFWNLLEIAAGFIPTNAFTYATNRRWVFVAGRHQQRKEFFLFTAAAFISLVVAEGSAYAFMTHTTVGDFLVKLAVIAICTFVNFTFRKLVVFHN